MEGPSQWINPFANRVVVAEAARTLPFIKDGFGHSVRWDPLLREYGTASEAAAACPLFSASMISRRCESVVIVGEACEHFWLGVRRSHSHRAWSAAR